MEETVPAKKIFVVNYFVFEDVVQQKYPVCYFSIPKSVFFKLEESEKQELLDAVDVLLKQVPGYVGEIDQAREKLLDVIKKKNEEQRSVS